MDVFIKVAYQPLLCKQKPRSMFVAKYKSKWAQEMFPVVANNTRERRMAKERELVEMGLKYYKSDVWDKENEGLW